MDAEQFEREYAARSGMTVERLRELGRVVRACDCDFAGCYGWRSVSLEHAAELDLRARNDPTWADGGTTELRTD